MDHQRRPINFVVGFHNRLLDVDRRGTSNSKECRTVDPRFSFTGLSWSIFDTTECTGSEPSVYRKKHDMSVQTKNSSFVSGVESYPPDSHSVTYFSYTLPSTSTPVEPFMLDGVYENPDSSLVYTPSIDHKKLYTPHHPRDRRTFTHGEDFCRFKSNLFGVTLGLFCSGTDQR